MKKLLCVILTLVLITASLPLLSMPAFAAFNTTLTNLTGLSKTWTQQADGLYSNSDGWGDTFALSSTTTSENFSYEADVKFNGNAAASLIFRSGNNPSDGSYFANIDLFSNNARVYRFGVGATLGEFSLPAEMIKSEYNMRVEVIGRHINYYIDNVLVISCDDNTPNPVTTGGRLGLLTFTGSVTYQNLTHKVISDKPALTTLDITGAELKPTFDADVYGYKMTVPHNVDSIELTPTAAAGCSAVVSAIDKTGAPVTVATQGAKAIVPTAADMSVTIEVTKGDTTISYGIIVTKEPDPATIYREEYRPQLHFTPFKNFQNDPNGLVYDPSNQTYHMYFQYNPYGMGIGNQVWGHAESTDLVNWKEIPEIAIDQDDGLGAIFSGSAVIDENNTSGLFTDNLPGESKIVAIFTHDGGNQTYGNEKQSIAYSKDHGHTYIKPSLEKEGFENPVLKNTGDKYGRDFRDPKVFWYDDQWMMVIAGGRARIFTSPDLINWSEVCDMGFDSECPDLFPLPIDGDENNIKWVYTASGDWYVIGRLEKANIVSGVQRYRFVEESARTTYNGAPEVYATQSFFNDGSNLNRRMLVSWLQDNTSSQLPGKTWNGVQTIPLVAGIKTVNGKMILTSYPVDEIKNQRSAAPIYTAANKNVTADTANILAGIAGEKYDIEATFTLGSATEFGFKLRKGIGEETVVKYDKTSGRFITDLSRGGKVMTGIHSMPMTILDGNKVKMRIIVDTSVLEVFGNDGEAPISALFFPNSSSVGMEFYTNGTVTIDSMKIYDMKSIWRDDFSDPPEDGVFLSTPDVKVPVGSDIKIDSTVFPSNAANKEIVWTIADENIFEIKSGTDTRLTATAKAAGVTNITATIKGTSISKTISIEAFESGFVSNLTDWKSVIGSWAPTDSGYRANRLDGQDVMAMSGVTGKAFTYECDAIPDSGSGCMGLVFGVRNATAPKSETWYCANIDTFGGGNAKLFENSGDREEWNVVSNIQKTSGTYRLKVNVDIDGYIKYWVNDVLVAERASSITNGTFGLVTWNSGGTFNNIKVTLLGDVNNDLSVDSADITILRNVILGTQNPTPTQIAALDVNNDGKTNLKDIMHIRRIILK